MVCEHLTHNGYCPITVDLYTHFRLSSEFYNSFLISDYLIFLSLSDDKCMHKQFQVIYQFTKNHYLTLVELYCTTRSLMCSVPPSFSSYGGLKDAIGPSRELLVQFLVIRGFKTKMLNN